MPEYETIENRVKTLEQGAERNAVTHKEFYERLAALDVTLAKMGTEYQNIMAMLSEVKNDVKELKEKPAKRWEYVVNIVLQWAVLGVLASTILFK